MYMYKYVLYIIYYIYVIQKCGKLLRYVEKIEIYGTTWRRGCVTWFIMAPERALERHPE